MFTRAHGSLHLPEGSSLEGDPFPLRGTLSAIGCNFLSLVLPIYIGTHPGEIIRKLDPIRWRDVVFFGIKSLPSAEELEEKEMEKNMGKAFYLILKLKNYRKTLL